MNYAHHSAAAPTADRSKHSNWFREFHYGERPRAGSGLLIRCVATRLAWRVKSGPGQAFIGWLVAPAGQQAIGSYKIDGQQVQPRAVFKKYGSTLPHEQ